MKRIILIAAVCAAAIALASCASLQRSWDQWNVENVATLIDTGQSARLAAMSTTPFLVDGEIVLMKADVAGFWNGIIKAGFKIEGPVLQSGQPLTANSYKQFADTMEVKSFFGQYARKGSRLLELKTSAGKSILLIVRDSYSRTIQGFKGPY